MAQALHSSERLRIEANAWAKARVDEHFASARGFEALTAGEVLSILDNDVTQPRGWSMMLEDGSPGYRERYRMVRNHLEVLARQRKLVIGSATNVKGRTDISTYSRPVDQTAAWSVTTKAANGTAAHRAEQRVHEWLKLDDGVLEHVYEIHLVRTSGGTIIHEDSTQAPIGSDDTGTAAAKAAARKRSPGRRRRETA